MADPAIEHTGLRYAVSLAAVLAIVLVAIGVLVALPSSIPYEGAVTWTVVLLATGAALEVTHR